MVEKVTCVIPCWNSPQDHIDASVASARECGLGVVLVDDGSEIPIKAPKGDKIRLIRLTENKGPSAAKNAGILIADTPWIAHLDCGDVFLPAPKIEQINWTVSHNLWATFSRCYEGDFFRVESKIEKDWQNTMFTHHNCYASTLITHRDGPKFDESLIYCSDTDFQCAVHLTIGWRFFDKPTARIYRHEGGHTDLAMTDSKMRQLKARDRSEVLKRMKRWNQEWTTKH